MFWFDYNLIIIFMTLASFLENVCVRISPYRLKWDEAEAKCQTEGSHLLSILSESIQLGVNRLLKKKESIKEFFEINKFTTTELDGYWTGGTVSLNLNCLLQW